MLETLKRTPLHAIHQQLGARMMPFAGYDMPVQYSGIIEEHMAVREAAGMFDVSHMGEILARGPAAFDFVQQLVTNDAARLYDGRAMYTLMCNDEGGIVDDLLVYRITQQEYLLVVNASNLAKDFTWMCGHNPMDAELINISEDTALVAIQGPKAFQIVEQVTDVRFQRLKYYHFIKATAGNFLGCRRALVSRTGYTGEPGLEIYCESEKAEAVWNALLEAGTSYGLKPAGLGARDTLRLEAGYSLYGNELTEQTNPLEAGLEWVVKFDKGDFIGRAVLEQVRAAGPARRLVAFVLSDRGVPRHGYPIERQGTPIGEVTSGTQSPVLGRGIGMGYVENKPAFAEPGSQIAVSVRGRPLSATVHKPPLHKVNLPAA